MTVHRAPHALSAALAGLLIIAHASIDLKNTLLGKHHYLLFWLAVAMQPRMCMLLDDKLEPIKTQVRVGTAVDTVGQVTAAAPRFRCGR